MKAVERVTADPKLHTPDLGGKATTAVPRKSGLRQSPHKVVLNGHPQSPGKTGRILGLKVEKGESAE
jgi:hypothetical protein